ncbi:MAG: Flp pilus assembly protein CpaB, partial [Candidatus Dormiibacterota bacterium]
MRASVSGFTRRGPFTLLGIVLALVVIAAFVLVALNAGAASSSPQLNVVVATRDLQPRLPIDASALTMRTIPVPNDYPKLYFSKLSQVQGMVPLVTIATGQAITASDIAKPSQALGAQSEYLPIPSGYVALTIPTSEEQGVANFIQPDDYISVIATVANKGKVASMTVFTNLHVIRIGTQATTSGTTAPSSTSLTVVVTECQAEFITWFLTYASLKYALESYQDYLAPGSQTKDPKCPGVASAKGVTLDAVQAAFPTLF